MKWKIEEIQKQKKITFDELVQLKEELMQRNPEILDLSEVKVKGFVGYDAPLYRLFADAVYTITLPSSRTLEAVELPMKLEIFEDYQVEDQGDDENENAMIFTLEDDEISLDEVLADNILLEIPLQVLSEEEKKSDSLPKGKFWQVMSEEEYGKMKEEKKKDNSPFSSLNSLFDENNEISD